DTLPVEPLVWGGTIRDHVTMRGVQHPRPRVCVCLPPSGQCGQARAEGLPQILARWFKRHNQGQLPPSVRVASLRLREESQNSLLRRRIEGPDLLCTPLVKRLSCSPVPGGSRFWRIELDRRGQVADCIREFGMTLCRFEQGVGRLRTAQEECGAYQASDGGPDRAVVFEIEQSD